MRDGAMSLRLKQTVIAAAYVLESAPIRRRSGRPARSTPPRRSFATLASTCRACSSCRAY